MATSRRRADHVKAGTRDTPRKVSPAEARKITAASIARNDQRLNRAAQLEAGGPKRSKMPLEKVLPRNHKLNGYGATRRSKAR